MGSTMSQKILARASGRDKVAVGEIGGRVHHYGPGQRLGLAAGAVVDRHVMPGFDQPRGECGAHAPGADPSDPQAVVLGHVLLVSCCNRLHEAS